MGGSTFCRGALVALSTALGLEGAANRALNLALDGHGSSPGSGTLEGEGVNVSEKEATVPRAGALWAEGYLAVVLAGGGWEGHDIYHPGTLFFLNR